MSHDFYQNTSCEYFPCHKTQKPEEFSCIFCYCPLYALAEKCSGNFRYTDKGIKDCSLCLIPHKRENYKFVTEKTKELIELLRKKDMDENDSN